MKRVPMTPSIMQGIFEKAQREAWGQRAADYPQGLAMIEALRDQGWTVTRELPQEELPGEMLGTTIQVATHGLDSVLNVQASERYAKTGVIAKRLLSESGYRIVRDRESNDE